MPFDEFLNRRLTELLRFALALSGAPEPAQRLVVDVLTRAFPHWDAIVWAGREFVLVRTAIARAYLAADDAPTDDAAAPTDDAAAPAASRDGVPPEIRLPGVDRHGRAAFVLTEYSAQTAAEVAAALRSTEPEAQSAVADARAVLEATTPEVARADPGVAIEAWVQSQELGEAEVAAAVLDRLEAGQGSEPPASFDAMFSMTVTRSPLSAPAGWEPSRVPASPEAITSTSSAVGSLPTRISKGAPSVPARGAGRASASTSAWLLRAGRAHRAAGLGLVAIAVVVSAALSHEGPVDAGRTGEPDGGSAATSSATATPQLLPGSTVLRDETGAGAGTMPGVARTAAPGDELALNVVCSGPGGASVGPLVIARCRGRSVNEGFGSAQLRSLPVRTDPSTTWRVQVVEQPRYLTNGRVRYPVDPLLRAAATTTRVGQGSGTGRGSVRLISSSTTSRVQAIRVILTCTGSGIRLTSVGHSFAAQYTGTCLTGYSYEFDIASAVVPDTLTVLAAPGTEWRLVALRS